MKKIVVLILALLMSFSMFSCADTNSRVNSDKSDDSDNTASPEELIIGTWEGEISADQNTNDTTSPAKLIVGTWKGQDGFFTFLDNGHFACDFVDAVVGDGEYTITEDTLTLSWERNGNQKVINMTLILLTEETLSFSDSQRTYVLHKA